LGVISTTQALTRAHEQGLDLIEVAPDARPPVCHIANLGKWQYEQAKKTRLERKEGKHRQSETKGVRITMRASTHDLAFRARQADGFLKEGHKVRLELAMYGRDRIFRPFDHSLAHGARTGSRRQRDGDDNCEREETNAKAIQRYKQRYAREQTRYKY